MRNYLIFCGYSLRSRLSSRGGRRHSRKMAGFNPKETQSPIFLIAREKFRQVAILTTARNGKWRVRGDLCLFPDTAIDLDALPIIEIKFYYSSNVKYVVQIEDSVDRNHPLPFPSY